MRSGTTCNWSVSVDHFALTEQCNNTITCLYNLRALTRHMQYVHTVLPSPLLRSAAQPICYATALAGDINVVYR